MSTKRIAIIGRVRKEQVGEPEQQEEAIAAAELLGKELATSGFGLIVYSGSPKYIERHVVSGYIKSGKAVDGSIVVEYPQEDIQAIRSFAEYDNTESRRYFDGQPHKHRAWDVPFYRSFEKVHGIVLIGGGETIFVVGMLALAWRVPLVAISKFGLRAKDVWEQLDPKQDLPSSAGIKAMASTDVTANAAQQWVQSLKDQANRKKREQAQVSRRHIVPYAALALVGWLALFIVGICFVTSVGKAETPQAAAATQPVMETNNNPQWIGRPYGIPLLTILVVIPLVGGAVGVFVRAMFQPGVEFTSTSLVLAMIAGVVVGLLTIADKVIGNGPAPQVTALLTTTLAGLLGGLAADSVWNQLLARTPSLPAFPGTAGSSGSGTSNE